MKNERTSNMIRFNELLRVVRPPIVISNTSLPATPAGMSVIVVKSSICPTSIILGMSIKN